MFRLALKIPRSVFVAVSGGPDSMAALDFLRRAHEVTALHFNHGTRHGRDAEEFVVDIMTKMGIRLVVGRIGRAIGKNESPEEYWRSERYVFFRRAAKDEPLVTAHTLDDAMENWVFTSLHGTPRLIPVRNGNIIRPFILSRKTDMLDWCQRKGVPFVNDPGNADLSFPRARIRKAVMPELLGINPGFAKVIARRYGEEDHVQDHRR